MALASLNVAYADQEAVYDQRFGGVPGFSKAFVAGTDTFARGWMQTFSDLARRYHYLTSAIVFDLAEDVCHQHNRLRSGRTVPERVITQQMANLQRTAAGLEREGIQRIFTFRSPDRLSHAYQTVPRPPRPHAG